MVGLGEATRRIQGHLSGRLASVPILALSVHSACNCRCVMCDIWKANADQREISVEDLARHVDAIRALHVQRVMLTGGEPLLHRNLWSLCRMLRESGIRLTLVTTGLLISTHAADIASLIDTVVVSLDGDRDVHDAIRRVPAFKRVTAGVSALRSQRPVPRLIARCVVQRQNCSTLTETIAAAAQIGFDEISFLAADVSTAAFNRPNGWTDDRVADVAIGADDLALLEDAVERAVAANLQLFANGFVAGGRRSLDRIVTYYRALAGGGEFPAVECNAPWMSAVLERGDTLRPCFFQPAYGSARDGLQAAINSTAAIAFRRALDVSANAICRRCVCSLKVSPFETV